MSEQREPLLVFSTVGDAPTARRLAASVVEAGLAACVNILPPVTSVFRWQPDAGVAAARTEDEVMLVAKTTTAAYPALERHLRVEHPYELPEIIAVPITHGLPDFLHWIDEATRC